jgi:hypothetical protein
MRLSNSDLKELSKDLEYEVSMIVYCAHELLKSSSEDSQEAEPHRNAIIESFLVHYRNLREFFWQKDPAGDDLVATDYGFSSSGQTPTELESIKVAVNKRLQHLSKRRREESNAGLPSTYDINSITRILLTECKDFREQVGGSLDSEFPSAEKIGQWADYFKRMTESQHASGSGGGNAGTASFPNATIQFELPEDLRSLD